MKNARGLGMLCAVDFPTTAVRDSVVRTLRNRGKGLGGVQFVLVGHPLHQFVGFGWCAVCSCGTPASPVCGVLVVCSVFLWDTRFTSLWGLDSVQCVPVGHPLHQFVGFWWCAVSSCGTPASPVCGVWVVCSVFLWDTRFTSLWGLGCVQCVPACVVCSSGTSA